jgi:serine/threonine-protein kinase
MAEIWLGVLEGAAGFRKPVVLKRAMTGVHGDLDRARRSLAEEARVAAALQHPNVVHVYDLLDTPEGLMLAMEYLAGASLRSLLAHLTAQDDVVPWTVAARIGADVARGLDHAHRATGVDGRPLRIVHRDVSPENVVVTESGIAKLVDFGIAQAEQTPTSGAPERNVGKTAYASPEQLLALELDSRSDVFSLGVVLHELFSGALPFPDPDAALRADPPRLAGSVPAVIADAVRRMLVRDPALRRVTLPEVSDALERALAVTPGGTHRDVAVYLDGELGRALSRRRERVRVLIAPGAARPVGPGRTELTSTAMLMETALDDEDTAIDRAGPSFD